MKTIAIDHLPIEKNPIYSNDFNSAYIYSNIMLPLFKHNGKAVRKNACKNFKIIGNKYIIEIYDNIKYNNGQQVNINDYYTTFKNILNKKCYAKYLLENVKKIYVKKNRLIFILKHKDKFFLEKLTFFAFSPYNNGLTCGPYCISKKDHQFILLSKNKYSFLNTKNNSSHLKFIYYKNDVQAFFEGKVDRTNITTFPVEQIHNMKPNIFDSNMFFVVKFSPKLMNNRYRKFRKFISNNINKEEINKSLKKTYTIKNDFLMNNNCKLSVKKTRKKSGKLLNNESKLILGYTDFYPNGKIANILKEQLENLDLNISNKIYKLCKATNYDLYIDIIYSPFFSEESLYLSKYFKIVNGKLYRILCGLYESTKIKIFFEIIKFICSYNSNIIPLFKNKYIYLER